jgi:hypothetical protein
MTPDWNATVSDGLNPVGQLRENSMGKNYPNSKLTEQKPCHFKNRGAACVLSQNPVSQVFPRRYAFFAVLAPAANSSMQCQIYFSLIPLRLSAVHFCKEIRH